MSSREVSALEESIARAMCEATGKDPEGSDPSVAYIDAGGHWGGPCENWKLHVTDAKKFLAGMAVLKQQKS